MGFYHAATIVKDAQRHGQRMLAVDVQRSAWLCTVEEGEAGHRPAVRLGFRYVKGLRESAGHAIVAARAERPFQSIADLATRARLERDELGVLAGIGALAPLGVTRRAGLWTTALPSAGPLFAGGAHERMASPLPEMNELERLVSDYGGTGVTLGRHPMALRRGALTQEGVTRACDLGQARVGRHVRVAGSVIVRQRPGTAKGFVFLSLEDETGVTNVIITPQLFARHRVVLVTEPFLLVDGMLQAQDGVMSIRAGDVRALPRLPHAVPSHDFG
jgi:error-prone DNA polymerase